MTNPATQAVESELSSLDSTAEPVIAGKSPTQIALERLRGDKVAITCAAILIVIIVAAAFAPLITSAMKITWDVQGPHVLDPVEVTDAYNMPCIAGDNDGCTTDQNFRGIGSPGTDTWRHPLGIAPNTATDNLATLLFGIRNSLIIAVIATVVTTVIGLVVGLMAGFSRGWLDRVLSFVVDLFLSLPYILMALSVAPMITEVYATDQAGLQRAQFVALIVILSFLSWMGLARLVRGQVLSLRESEFVLAAQVMGASTTRILFKELLPNLVATLVVSLSISVPAFIGAEVGLSYLGLGLTGSASMGQLIQSATGFYEEYPLYLWAPVFVLVVLVLTLNLLGDSIRDAFDPKTRR